MWNMQLPQATACVSSPPKPRPRPRFWFAREVRLISANTGANIETGPLLTHLSQCESCVMIWVVWMAVCLDLLRCRVPGWVRGRERWSLAAEECFLYHDSINRHHLLWRWRKVELEIWIKRDGLLALFRESVSTTHQPRNPTVTHSEHRYKWNQTRWWLVQEPLTLWYKSHYSSWKTKRKFLMCPDAGSTSNCRLKWATSAALLVHFCALASHILVRLLV